MAGFKTGVAVGAVSVGALAIWLILKIESQPISFPSKAVMADANYVSVIGSIVGDDAKEEDRPQNNMARMECWRSKMSCTFTTVNETQPGHVGFPFTDQLTVRQWNEREMVADSLLGPDAAPPCNYYEIRFIFGTKDVAYTRIPNSKADQASCKDLFGSDNSIKQWRIGNGKASYDYIPGKS